jgi:hypothetical protein
MCPEDGIEAGYRAGSGCGTAHGLSGSMPSTGSIRRFPEIQVNYV